MTQTYWDLLLWNAFSGKDKGGFDFVSQEKSYSAGLPSQETTKFKFETACPASSR